MSLTLGRFRLNSSGAATPITPLGSPYILWDTRHFTGSIIPNEGTSGNIFDLALNPVMAGTTHPGRTIADSFNSSGPDSLLPLTSTGFVGRRSTVSQGPNDTFGFPTNPIQLPTTSSFPRLFSNFGGQACTAGFTFMVAISNAAALPQSLISGVDADNDSLNWMSSSVTSTTAQVASSLPRTEANVQTGSTWNGSAPPYSLKLLTFYINYSGQLQRMWVDGTEILTGFTSTWAGTCADLFASADELFSSLTATLGTNRGLFPPEVNLAWNGVVGLAAFRGTPTVVDDITPWRNFWFPAGQSYHALSTPTIVFDQTGNGTLPSTGSWTVTAGVSKVRVEVTSSGGPFFVFDVPVSAGDVFSMSIGGQGATNSAAGGAGGWPDGGQGGPGSSVANAGGGGSGSTKVTLNGTTLVHLGGRGGYRNSTGSTGPVGHNGRSAVVPATTNSTSTITGGNGTMSAAGLGGIADGGGTAGTAGSGSTGGVGGHINLIGAGGGGGGYFGGGGGGACLSCGPGVTVFTGFGGGGSSYANFGAMIRWTEGLFFGGNAPGTFANSRVRIARP